MTKTVTFVTILALTLSSAALALSEAAADIDTNGDGVLTIDELQAVHPEFTMEAFTAMDLNADGALDGDEVTAAEEAGLMPTADRDG